MKPEEGQDAFLSSVLPCQGCSILLLGSLFATQICHKQSFGFRLKVLAYNRFTEKAASIVQLCRHVHRSAQCANTPHFLWHAEHCDNLQIHLPHTLPRSPIDMQ